MTFYTFYSRIHSLVKFDWTLSSSDKAKERKGIVQVSCFHFTSDKLIAGANSVTSGPTEQDTLSCIPLSSFPFFSPLPLFLLSFVTARLITSLFRQGHPHLIGYIKHHYLLESGPWGGAPSGSSAADHCHCKLSPS